MKQLKNTKEYLEKWDAYRKSIERSTGVPIESDAVKAARIKKLLGNFEEFCKYYFPSYCSADFAPFQLEMASRIIKSEKIYTVAAWAREHSKSVVTGFFVPLFLKFNKKAFNFIQVSYSKDNADELLMPIMVNLESNQRIINDYGRQKSWRGWEIGKFTTLDGCSFRAIGSGQSPRGTRNEEKRPDYIHIDDIDTDEMCRNQARVEKTWQWVEKALIPAMSIAGNKRIVFAGNIIGKKSIITKAMKVADFHQIINILDSKGRPSWPQKNTIEDINYMLSKISYASGQSEYFNNPIVEGTVFKNLTYGKVPPLSKFKYLVSYTDPSYKDSKKNDFKATILVGELDGIFYIVRAFVEQTSTANMIKWHYAIDEMVGDKTVVYYYMESNFLQDIFLDEFRKAGIVNSKFIPVAGDDRKKPDKYSRIEANLEPLNRNGQLIFNIAQEENPHMRKLVEQFEAVEPGMSAHDDGPDATEGAVWIINNKLKVLAPIKVAAHQRTKYKY